jgi:hypothetical protein
LGGLSLEDFTQVADTEVFDADGLPGGERIVVGDGRVEIPPQSCALWMLA